MSGTTVNLTPNALTVLEKRYLKKDENEQVCETPEEIFWRVARGFVLRPSPKDGC